MDYTSVLVINQDSNIITTFVNVELSICAARKYSQRKLVIPVSFPLYWG